MGGKFWALQSGTSHNLGDHFSRVFGIRYLDRDGERIYHLPGQANYDRVEADSLFESEEQAQAAGFRPAQR